MDKTNDDKTTRDILLNSKLELTNPDFNRILMDKIRIESRKQSIFNNLVMYGLIFVSIDVFIIVVLNLLNIKITNISTITSTFTNGIHDISSNLSHLLIIYFVILAIMIFGLNLVSGYRLPSKYSGSHR